MVSCPGGPQGPALLHIYHVFVLKFCRINQVRNHTMFLNLKTYCTPELGYLDQTTLFH